MVIIIIIILLVQYKNQKLNNELRIPSRKPYISNFIADIERSGNIDSPEKSKDK